MKHILSDLSLIEKRRVFYTTILSQLLSDDGHDLIVGCKSGKLALFPFGDILSNNANADLNESADVEMKTLRSPSQTILLPSLINNNPSPIYSLVWFNDNENRHCISGGKGMINTFQLSDDRLHFKWSLNMPQNDIMVNCLSYINGSLFAGCGDNHIYGFDINTQTIVIDFDDHKDYVNSLALSDDRNMLFSCSEDGTVRIWDLRHNKSVGQLEPYKNATIARPTNGKWIGALATDGKDWLLCGGGPSLSLWHLRSMSSSTKFEVTAKPEWSPNIVQFHGDFIIGGGNASAVYLWEMNGHMKSQIPSSASNIFSLSTKIFDDDCNDVGIDQVICAAGTSYKIDVCTNWKYKDFELIVM